MCSDMARDEVDEEVQGMDLIRRKGKRELMAATPGCLRHFLTTIRYPSTAV